MVLGFAGGVPALADGSVTTQATCTGPASLQNALTTAGDGDTIVLTGLCTGLSLSLPATANLTITGAATGTNGFDGTGASGPALSGGSNGLTLSKLTFKNYGATAVRLTPNNPSNPYAFTNDTFSHNTQPFDPNVGSGGGLSLILGGTCSFSSTAVTVTGSTFDANSAGGSNVLTGGGGGGAYLESACSTAVTMQLDDNRFTNNTAAASGSNDAAGGGLWAATGARGTTTPNLTLIQNRNLFRANAVSGSGGTYLGGGEFTVGANLTSRSDGFIENSLPGPSAAAKSSEGGGLSTFGGGCLTPGGVTSSAANLVAAGNTIGAPSGTGTGDHVEGAGVYVGCSGLSAGAYHMTLINATISANTALGAPANAVAGIDGESGDFLAVKNTIVFGDNGGAELGGFGASTGANVTADASDVCAVGSTTVPFAGAANLCTSPLLADAGHGDVHQTTASPMIDAGANVDLPNDLATDYYSGQRLQYGHISDLAPRVDIGASESHPSTPTATDCDQLAALLGQAVNGDVITLATMCTGRSFTLPDDTSLTLQGASTGTNGLDGVGAPGEGLNGQRVAGLTLRNLTIRNYNLSEPNGASAVDLQLANGPLPTIDHVQFLRNTSNGEPAGLLFNAGQPGPCGLTGTLTISNSTFADNVIGGSGQTFGAGVAMAFGCPAHVAISGNQFTNNMIQAPGTGFGAGVSIVSTAAVTVARQDHNVFRGNSIVGAGPPGGKYMGAGEALWGVALTSTDDTFIGNTIAGPVGSGAFSKGAGLGITDLTCGQPGTPAAGTATNLVAAGNTIGAASSGASAAGAGVFAGCAFDPGQTGGPLTLINSTVSGNSLPGGIAGLAGEPGDPLTLSNSIIAGNTGAGSANIGGFGIGVGSGSATVSYSDVCTPGANTPLAGAHTLCADPKLAAAASGDVHETASSPTIDAGFNALVPIGLTTDAYGAARIFATKTCTSVVDVGAAEFGTRTATCPPPRPPPPPPPPKTVVRSEKTTTTGVDVALGCTGKGTCSGNVTLTTTETRTGKRVIAVASATKRTRHTVTVTVGSASYRLAAGKRTTLHLKLNGPGKSLLARFHKLPVTVRVTQTIGKKTVRMSTRKQTIVAPKRKRKR